MPQEGVARLELSPYTKPTYLALSQALDAAAYLMNGSGEGVPDALEQHLKDQLFLSPRLKEWKKITGGFSTANTAGAEFRIYNIQQNVFVSVYRNRVELERAGDTYTVISDSLLAETLFTNIENAQFLVQAPSNYETDPESFFEEADEDCYEGVGLDSALEESVASTSQSVGPVLEEDAELIEEVVAETEIAIPTTMDDMHLTDNIQTQLHDAKMKHEAKFNKSAAAEATQVKAEYRDAGTVNRLKSLQGRVLNIVEAAFSDKQQREAVKTLINKEFRRDMNKIQRQDED